MKGLDHVPEPSDAELADIDDELDEDADFEGHGAITPSPEFEANRAEYESRHQVPTGDSRRERLHRNARDMTRIEQETQWAFLSREGGFLAPRSSPKTTKGQQP